MTKEIFIQEKRPHESGAKHVSGYAHYTDDLFEPEGTLYGAIGWAKKSHAIIIIYHSGQEKRALGNERTRKTSLLAP